MNCLFLAKAEEVRKAKERNHHKNLLTEQENKEASAEQGKSPAKITIISYVDTQKTLKAFGNIKTRIEGDW